MHKISFTKLARLAVIPAMIAGATMAGPSASAADGNLEAFSVCFKNSDCNMGYTSGTIYWPTRELNGKVVSRVGGDYSTTAVFEAFSGTGVKLGSETRTSRDGAVSFGPMYFHLMTTRVKITVCQNWADGSSDCGSPENYSYG
ncbi:hypothetical protein ACIBHX_46390 [Nonomuraea sp. NPDC050536]|uniref:hypothetical protein n=1 Tax=Nonomuraea sp. NPDC050536 TaxID=3364366 RepID=UPI0037C676A6